MTASKLPTLFELVHEGLSQGKSIVVGLLGTGEAYSTANEASGGAAGGAAAAGGKGSGGGSVAGDGGMAGGGGGSGGAGGGGGSTDGLPPAPAAILRAVITSVLFPRCAAALSASGATTKDGRDGKDGKDAVDVEEAEELRLWLERANGLELPANPLDAIMHDLQKKRVAAVELSGRQEVRHIHAL